MSDFLFFTANIKTPSFLKNWNIYLFISLIFQLQFSFAQESELQKNVLKIDFETRPRTELRSNHTTISEFQLTHRNRMTVNYKLKNILFHSSLQEIHVWGANDVVSNVGSINTYETFINATLHDNFSVKLGRQSVSLDNGRMFSAAPWAQQSRAHEGLRLTYKTEKMSNDVFALAARNYTSPFELRYSAVASHKYKFMPIHQLSYKFNKNVSLLTINSAELMRNETLQKNYTRISSGARLEVFKDKKYATLTGYYQYGQNNQLQQLRAVYLQAELKTVVQKTILKLGAEFISGTRENAPAGISNGYEINYGVAWKFMGNMNFFTRFPNDHGNKGLVNPYLFVIQPIHKKLSLRSDFNLFYNQFALMAEGIPQNKYLGFEQDLSLNYKPNKNTEIRYGFSYLSSSPTMGILNKVKNTNQISLWSFLMISYEFNVLNKSFSKN